MFSMRWVHMEGGIIPIRGGLIQGKRIIMGCPGQYSPTHVSAVCPCLDRSGYT